VQASQGVRPRCSTTMCGAPDAGRPARGWWAACRRPRVCAHAPPPHTHPTPAGVVAAPPGEAQGLAAGLHLSAMPGQGGVGGQGHPSLGAVLAVLVGAGEGDDSDAE